MHIPSDIELLQQAKLLGQQLLAKQQRLSVAESCTGGWISKVITDVPGSSAWFDRAFITYTDQAKHDLLKVGSDVLAQFGAVSEQTVMRMAQGALENSLADLSIAVSGIAGPAGGSVEKPVGLVWFAWGNKKSDSTHCEAQVFAGDRESIRRQAVHYALEHLTD